MEDILIGSILLLPYGFQMEGFISCDGQSIPISGNEALYSLIGTSFGGDGNTKFSLPNLNALYDPCHNALPLPHMKYFIATEGIYPDRP